MQSSTQTKDLEQIKKLAIRLEIALLSAKGKTPSQISRQLKISRPTVYLWRQRHKTMGLEGLQQDLPRSGRKPTYSQKQEATVLKKARKSRQENAPYISIASLAQSTGLSYDITRRILLTNNLPTKPKRKKSKLHSNQKRKGNYPKKKEPKPSLLSKHKKITANNTSERSTQKQSHFQITQSWIAQQCGVSQATVSLALKGDLRVRQDTRLKVIEFTQKHHYFPNPNSSGLAHLRWHREKRHTNLALLTGKSIPPAQLQFYTLLKNKAIARGYTLEIIKLDKTLRPEALNNQLYQQGIQGVFLGRGIPRSLYQKLKTELEWTRLSALSLIANPKWLNCIRPPAPLKLISHCLDEMQKSNYQRISYLFFPKSTSDKYTLNTFLLEELLPADLAYNPRSINPIHSLTLKTQNTKEQLVQLSTHLQKHNPEAILCNSDAGYTLLKQATTKRSRPAFVSLNKQSSQDKQIAGLTFHSVDESADFTIRCMDQQIRNNEFGLPYAPINRRLSFKSWSDGLSFPSRLEKKRNFEKENTSSLSTPKAKEAHFKILDLKPAANQTRMAKGGWMGPKRLTLASGPHHFNDIPFNILKEDTYQQHSIIMMQSSHKAKEGKKFSSHISLDIREKYKSCHILHTCGWVASRMKFAHYKLSYRDGSEITLPLISHYPLRKETPGKNEHNTPKPNIGDWYCRYPTEAHLFQDNTTPISLPYEGNAEDPAFYNLFALKWENPYPDKEPKALHIESDPEQPITLAILAITLEK